MSGGFRAWFGLYYDVHLRRWRWQLAHCGGFGCCFFYRFAACADTCRYPLEECLDCCTVSCVELDYIFCDLFQCICACSLPGCTGYYHATLAFLKLCEPFADIISWYSIGHDENQWTPVTLDLSCGLCDFAINLL